LIDPQHMLVPLAREYALIVSVFVISQILKINKRKVITNVFRETQVVSKRDLAQPTPRVVVCWKNKNKPARSSFTQNNYQM